ncbi:MAG: YitT family protein [Heliobacteriaceae bacterium]|nr:YitT family protein [Heliobacteriaceae bacterium]
MKKTLKLTKKEKFLFFLNKIFFLTLGALIAAFAVECFLFPNNVIDGGIIGISMIISYLSKWNLGVLVVLLNMPFIFLAFNKIGKRFVLQTFYALVMLAVFINLFAHYTFTDDVILAAVFGGIVLGIGVGLILRNEGSLDGTEIMSLILSKKFGFSVGEIIMAFNLFIYTGAGFVFGWNKAMYSILTYFIAYKVIDIVLEGLNSSKSVNIISDCSKEIGQSLLERLEVGVTYTKGKGAYSGADKTIITCVISRLELSKLKEIVKEIDPSAFTTIVEVNEVYGGRIKRG